MEIGKQIQQCRTAAEIRQDERLYIARQTLSNRDTCKTCPDVNSSLRLSKLFYSSPEELKPPSKHNTGILELIMLIIIPAVVVLSFIPG